MYFLVSFDIFDTCLVRKCGEARNLFDILSYKVFTCSVDEGTRQAFVSARIKAGFLSDSIEGIYSNLNFNDSRLCSTNELIERELQCELDMLVPVNKSKDLVNTIRRKNPKIKIAFISDMYFPSDFLKNILVRTGFWGEGDTIYVSGDVGKTKYSGDLFDYVSSHENIPFKKWKHYGDNNVSDFLVPKSKGIKCEVLRHEYSKYEEAWIQQVNIGFPYSSILAGVSRATRLSNVENSHTLFVTNIVAPFYVTLVWHILSEAKKDGIGTIYFFARDTYTHFLVAKRLLLFFEGLDVQYLKVSQTALYEGDNEAKELYFQQIGLASKNKKNAIFDLCSSGHSLAWLNAFMQEKGYMQLKAYYFEIFCVEKDKYDIQGFKSVINHRYVTEPSACFSLSKHRYLIEMFFSMNMLQRTKGYCIKNGTAEPIYEDDNEIDETSELIIENKSFWAQVHNDIILKFTDYCISVGLCKSFEAIFERIALQNVFYFFENPQKEHLRALLGVYGYDWKNGKHVPYIKKESLFKLIASRAKGTCWRRGTINYSLTCDQARILRKALSIIKPLTK